MVLAKGKLSPDPRDLDAVVPFKRPEEEVPPDMWSLGALVCSLMVGLCSVVFTIYLHIRFDCPRTKVPGPRSVNHTKGGAWLGAMFATAAICNKRSYDSDWKQIYTGVMFSFSALFIMAMNAYQGMKAREAAGAGDGAAM